MMKDLKRETLKRETTKLYSPCAPTATLPMHTTGVTCFAIQGEEALHLGNVEDVPMLSS